jgi:hypothetical protein
MAHGYQTVTDSVADSGTGSFPEEITVPLRMERPEGAIAPSAPVK